MAGIVTALHGEAMLDGLRQGAFERTLGPGSLIATGEGRVDVQFGDASALALGPRSSLQLRRFDAETIELVVDGTVDVVVAPRAPGQHFFVIAGDETVEVRGTQFRVARDAHGVRVACRHGLVAVRDGAGEVQIGAAHQAVIATGHAGETSATRLGDPEMAQLAAATPVTLPLWTSAAELAKSSAPLEIASTNARDVRVDGVELGEAPLRVRVMPGRHTVEAADHSGRYRRAGWVDVSTAKIARVEVQPVEEVAPTSGTAERQKQLHGSVDRGKLHACTRALSKEGIAGAFVQIEIAVDAAGAVNYLNALDSDLGTAGQDCVLGVLRQVRFAPGAIASWRERIDL
jgi:ferric-dicitrate binding protein FerR (iron transport regulator)